MLQGGEPFRWQPFPVQGRGLVSREALAIGRGTNPRHVTVDTLEPVGAP